MYPLSFTKIKISNNKSTENNGFHEGILDGDITKLTKLLSGVGKEISYASKQHTIFNDFSDQNEIFINYNYTGEELAFAKHAINKLSWTNTPINLAMKTACFEIFKLNNFLIYSKLSINVPDSRGLTPIFYACLFKNKDAISRLFANNADINYKLIVDLHKHNNEIISVELLPIDFYYYKFPDNIVLETEQYIDPLLVEENNSLETRFFLSKDQCKDLFSFYHFSKNNQVDIEKIKHLLITNFIYNLVFHWKKIADNLKISYNSEKKLHRTCDEFKFHQENTYPLVANHINQLPLEKFVINILNLDKCNFRIK